MKRLPEILNLRCGASSRFGILRGVRLWSNRFATAAATCHKEVILRLILTGDRAISGYDISQSRGLRNER
jgi:hypothetical protein